jgi:hypothetical protein
MAFFVELPAASGGMRRYRLPSGPKIINALTKNIRRNAAEQTDAHPMYVVRYDDVAFFCKSFRTVGLGAKLDGVCGALRPIATATPDGLEANNPVTAYLVTDAALELECCPDGHDRLYLSGPHCVEPCLARCLTH